MLEPAHRRPAADLAGAMIVAAAIVVPSGLTLNPADPAATLTAVAERTGLHLIELAFDVLGWLTLSPQAWP